jgi:hypothetical protein
MREILQGVRDVLLARTHVILRAIQPELAKRRYSIDLEFSRSARPLVEFNKTT